MTGFATWSRALSRSKITLCVHSSLLIPPNKQQNLFPMNIAYWLWCWWFFALWIVEIDPLFIASDHSIKNDFLLNRSCKCSEVISRLSMSFSFNFYGTYFSSFWIFPLACKRLEIIYWSTSNTSANCLGFELNFRPAMHAILHL